MNFENRNRTSVSDSWSYTKICHLAGTDTSFFKTFKSNQNYQAILEHTSRYYGNCYLDILLERYGKEKTISILEKVKVNDIFGNPSLETYNIDDFVINISPSTLYYAKIWSDIIFMFKNTNEMEIVEIGGGYGGQCVVANAMGSFKKWSIYDLPEANLLQEKYLHQNNITKYDLMSSPNFESINDSSKETKKYDLLISNYAFSELERPIQEAYYNQVISNTQNGYMIMNFGWDINNQFTLQEIQSKIENSQIKDEIPKTGPNNCLVIWKSSKD